MMEALVVWWVFWNAVTVVYLRRSGQGAQLASLRSMPWVVGLAFVLSPLLMPFTILGLVFMRLSIAPKPKPPADPPAPAPRETIPVMRPGVSNGRKRPVVQ